MEQDLTLNCAETWSTSYYTDLVARLFPDQPGVKCYELFLVHLAIVPFEHIVQMGRDVTVQIRTTFL